MYYIFYGGNTGYTVSTIKSVIGRYNKHRAYLN